MFTSFLNIITSYFVDSSLLDEHIEVLLEKHPNFKDLIGPSDIFIEAFMKALIKTLDKEYKDELTPIWNTLITKLISYINN